ncbi:hypothetical protein APW41_13240, partial [Staphylococcus aureus]
VVLFRHVAGPNHKYTSLHYQTYTTHLYAFLLNNSRPATCRKSTHFNSKDDMIEVLTSDLKAHDRVLVKGSRGMKLEEVVNALIS